MKKFISFIFVLFINKIVGVKIHLYRKYPNVENGVYQLDSRARPIKIVDVNYNHRWEIPENGDINSYTVVRKNGRVKKFSEGTNLIYGTTKRKIINDIKEVDEQSQEEVKNDILKNKKLNIIKNVSDVSKKEKDMKELEMKKKQKPPIAMYIAADDIPEEKKQKQEEDDINVANELGVAIKENLENHYEITKEPSPLSTDLLNLKIPTTLEKLLMDDLDEIKWISKKPVNDKICMRDYSKQCPSMWEPITETQCSAPKDYSGPCAHIMILEPMNAKEKSSIARDCKVNWSCINESCGNGERDYLRECPENWTYNGTCEAPENYSGGCNKSMDFDAFTENEKEQFSSSCKVVWPCKEESCERDYSITCPKGWSYNVKEDMCMGSNELSGIISKEEIEAISHMSYHQRIAFSTKYGIPWPCKNKCTYGYDTYACPRGWLNLMNSGACKAPDDYIAPNNCPLITHFDYMDIKEKEKFSKICNVKWLCMENAQRDYSKCPIYFEYIKEGNHKGMCKPDEKYKGPCKEAQDILTLNLEQKYNFEETCEAQFPNLQIEDIPQSEQDLISQSTMEKLLNGTDLTNKSVTLE
ncbi:CPW-WPC family protein [Plasmodium gaboni]|uniref:CPW-WPC family protein n=1 Tax=Plasmodium gaboni TaxID=647221 RepID=A0A151LIK8_9APIC|nr:CPW-WPC family protein [Plasmodium gaboni]KYN98679.1 CPW-WPC family protein [Plasmodium gaboni]